MASTKLTCSICDVAFDNSQEHRVHAKSESHVQALRSRAVASGLIDQSAYNNYTVLNPSRDPTDSEDEVSQSDTDAENEVTDDAVPEFDSKKCIICPHNAQSFDESLNHMETTHSLKIPYQTHLTVDLETLIWYLHFIIFTYHECIACGTRRRTVEGLQQHMVDKGHCRVDLSDEMLEFYHLEGLKGYGTDTAVSVDDDSLRLASGKILSHRTAPSNKPHHQTSSPEEKHSHKHSLLSRTPSDALTTRDRKDAALASQLARLSVRDQQSLVHLPSSEQRSFLLQRKKEMNAVQRTERKMRLKTERLSNKTMMKNFVNDVPGRANG
ncbi:hypothetical protein FSARC_13985 [Fusarium sarcochroum]|uniref:C2H2-type domain-containing protein n=1 Tax=Fusarium sarcochroum TaxID=1208366 RepID=A0A8H4SX77_9HYPO|nr:hypothetical protein FSARC_13985 [Fusarium sarcochroum]